MNKIAEKVMNFLKDEEGLTTVEYAIAGSLVAGGVVTAFTALGTNISAAVGRISGYMAAPSGG